MSLNLDFDTALTWAALTFAALKVLPALYLARRPQPRLLEDKLAAALYFTSKLSGILVVAFALAAAAHAGRALESAGLSVLLVLAGALTFWSVYARFSGRFYGLAHLLRPRPRA